VPLAARKAAHKAASTSGSSTSGSSSSSSTAWLGVAAADSTGHLTPSQFMGRPVLYVTAEESRHQVCVSNLY
jgi:hypothetical protein